MKIGKLLKERMNVLGISFDDLINLTFIDVDILQQLYDNKIDFEAIDEYDKEILSNALFCSKEYFIDENARKYDIVMSSFNRGKEQDMNAIKTKCKLHNFVKDFIFINEIKNGGNDGK